LNGGGGLWGLEEGKKGPDSETQFTNDTKYENMAELITRGRVSTWLLEVVFPLESMLEFYTHSWRDHRILLFYSNSTYLHKVNPLGLRIGQDTLQYLQRKNLRPGRFLQVLQRTEQSVLSLQSLDLH
jgi:hypothetical protein